MPELPEVETVVRDLRPLLVGRTITSARQSKRKLRRPWKAQWNAQVAGARVGGIRRRGKWILIDLAHAEPTPPAPLPEGRGVNARGTSSNNPEAPARLMSVSPPPFREGGPGGVGSSAPKEKGKIGSSIPSPVLRVHLGMTGQFTIAPATDPEPDHLHVVFSLDNGNELRFRDQRRFGSAEYFPDRAALETEMNAELGPEPFGLDADYFRTSVRGTARNLKALLLDQKLVAGVGNIYADEACFGAKLHPGRAGKSLSPDECDRLREAIEAVMTRAIESRGSTIRDYVGGSGLRGGFQNEFAVYGRTDEPCPACETAIKCARFAGRASHFCPSCQPLAVRRQPAKPKPKSRKRKSA